MGELPSLEKMVALMTALPSCLTYLVTDTGEDVFGLSFWTAQRSITVADTPDVRQQYLKG